MTYDPTLDPTYWHNLATATLKSSTAQAKALAAEYNRVAGLLTTVTPPPVVAPPIVTPPVVPAPSAFRLFGANSAWNTVKSAGALTYATQADAMLYARSYGLNNGAYCHPFYVAKATDPLVKFTLGAGWGFPATTITANAPSNMAPATGTDGVMSVLLTTGTLLDMFAVTGGGLTYSAKFYGISDGVNGPGFGTQPYTAIGTTAIGCPQAAGTILASDVAAGVINHGLFIAFDYSDEGGAGGPGPQVAPAVSNDCGGGPGPLPQGGLLLATGPMPTGLNPMEQALWIAASTYGVYVCDKLGGGPMFYGDGSAAVGAAFMDAGLTKIGRSLRLVKTW